LIATNSLDAADGKICKVLNQRFIKVRLDTEGALDLHPAYDSSHQLETL
jgi:hypothetical protein